MQPQHGQGAILQGLETGAIEQVAHPKSGKHQQADEQDAQP
jgi:hypothetical protein